MLPSSILALLQLTAAVSALPELSIVKQRGHGPLVKTRRVRRSGGSVQTGIFEVFEWTEGGGYYTNITVGTPPQPMTVLIDTGSSDLYFDASTADSCTTSGSHSCQGGTFDLSKSTSYNEVAPANSFNTAFGDGSTAKGPFGSDIIGIGDVLLSNVQFGLATEVNSTVGPAIGLMGIGYSYIEGTEEKYPNIPEVLAATGVINSRLYSVYLNDDGAISGTVLFGGIDTSRYTGTLATIDLLYDISTGVVDQFITVITGMTATIGGSTSPVFSGGQPGPKAYRTGTSLPVLLDTGSAAWTVPETFFNRFVSPVFPYVDSQYLCSCTHASASDHIIIEINAQINITVPTREFILPYYDPSTGEPVTYTDGTDTCQFLIQPGEDDGGFMVAGDALLRSMYLVYDLDNGQVSIAQAQLNSTSSPNIVTVAAGPSGVAAAVSNVATGSPQQYSVAPTADATDGSFFATTASTTLSVATGTDAVPADERPKDKSAANAMPSWSMGTVWTVCISMLMAVFGMGLVL